MPVNDATLARDVAWLLSAIDEETPQRLHTRGVWTDPDTGAGSALGSPALDRDLVSWLCRPNAVRSDGGVMRYRTPAWATIDRLGRMPASPGMPTWGSTLRAIVRARGDLPIAGAELAKKYPAMIHPTAAHTHLRKAVLMMVRHYADGPRARDAAA